MGPYKLLRIRRSLRIRHPRLDERWDEKGTNSGVKMREIQERTKGAAEEENLVTKRSERKKKDQNNFRRDHSFLSGVMVEQILRPTQLQVSIPCLFPYVVIS